MWVCERVYMDTFPNYFHQGGLESMKIWASKYVMTIIDYNSLNKIIIYEFIWTQQINE